MTAGAIVKIRTAILVILVVSLLLSGTALQAAGPSPVPHTVEGCTMTGGGYRLSVQGWRITGAARGGNYSLSIPVEPSLRGNGCCCIYLPMVVRNAP